MLATLPESTGAPIILLFMKINYLEWLSVLCELIKEITTTITSFEVIRLVSRYKSACWRACRSLCNCSEYSSYVQSSFLLKMVFSYDTSRYIRMSGLVSLLHISGTYECSCPMCLIWYPCDFNPATREDFPAPHGPTTPISVSANGHLEI